MCFLLFLGTGEGDIKLSEEVVKPVLEQFPQVSVCHYSYSYECM